MNLFYDIDIGIVVVKAIMYLAPFFFSGIPILFMLFFVNKQYLIERESSHDYSQQSINPFCAEIVCRNPIPRKFHYALAQWIPV